MSALPQAGGRAGGVATLFVAYFLYALGDAGAKWLVGSDGERLPVGELLFLRSVLGLGILTVAGRARSLQALRQGRGLLGMNLANCAGWAFYYAAAVHLPLPQLVLAYYLSPICAALLAGPMLGERIAPLGWLAAALGFAGVVVTVAPRQSVPLEAFPALLGVACAACWGLAAVLYRRNVHERSSLAILLSSNLTMALACAPLLAWQGMALAPRQLAPLLLVAAAALAAHWLYIHGVRRVPIAVAAPIAFCSLVWAVILAYLFWGQALEAGFATGALLIVAAALLAARSRRPADVPVPRSGWQSGRR